MSRKRVTGTKAGKKRVRRRPGGRAMRGWTLGLDLANKTAFGVLIVMGCVAVAILALPQVRELRGMEGELVTVREREQRTMDEKDRKSRELAALRDDPEYLELMARDRLDLYKPGEKVIRVKRTRN